MFSFSLYSFDSLSFFAGYCFVLFNPHLFVYLDFAKNLYVIVISRLSFSLFEWFLCIYFFSLFCLLLNLKNILISLLLIELTYFGVVCCFLFLAVFYDIVFGFTFALLIILVAAAESVVGLGLAILVFRLQRVIMYTTLNSLRV